MATVMLAPRASVKGKNEIDAPTKSFVIPFNRKFVQTRVFAGIRIAEGGSKRLSPKLHGVPSYTNCSVAVVDCSNNVVVET